MDEFQKIQFWHIYEIKVGGIDVTIGSITREGQVEPPVYLYAAALSEDDLRRESCGYGVTEAAAVASLFEHMRPSSALIPFAF